MDPRDAEHSVARRDFLKGAAAVAAAATVSAATAEQPAAKPSKTIGIQVGAVSFVDEGVDQVLDILQERGHVNTIYLATFTYGRGIAGRQIPGQPLPDHGKQKYDEDTFHGGNYATPHAAFYEKTALKQTKAPDFGDYDVLAQVLPKAKQRGIRVYCWYEDVFRGDIPGVQPLQEIDLQGRPATTLCPLNPDYRNFLTGLTADYCKSYDIDGVMWGSERQGPLNNAIGASHSGRADPNRVTCFCERHRKAARESGIDVERALEGYKKLAQFVTAAQAGNRPSDGYFVTFWRLLVEHPELLAWEKLWTDGQHAIYQDVFDTAKKARPGVQVGFHIWHANSFAPFFRAEQDYAKMAAHADELKIVAYNLCGGPRYAGAIDNVHNTIFRDLSREEVFSFFNRVLDYERERPLKDLPTAGLSSDYVGRETRRAVAGVMGKCKIHPGIDIDIPTARDQKKTTPQDVYDSTTAALKAGASGVIFSRKYSEMRLDNLAGGGRAVKEFLG
jgi:TAT (twin-arginine translocation) pathway signal sequence